MTKPTVGRIVLYRARDGEDMASIVTAVHDDGRVNLAVFNRNGSPMGRTSVTLVQPGEDPPAGHYCHWPPRVDAGKANPQSVPVETAKEKAHAPAKKSKGWKHG